jgi:hypothetical protein
MKTTDFAEQWSSMQKMFLPNSTLALASRSFWENQNKILDNLQASTKSWFDRRPIGTHCAQEAAERMCETQNMADLFEAYQDWASGAFQRMMADGLACQQQIIAATGGLTSPPLAPPSN